MESGVSTSTSSIPIVANWLINAMNVDLAIMIELI